MGVADLYQTTLDALIEELGVRSVPQVYLVEKIHDCLWWMRCYQEQKRATVIVQMASLTGDSLSLDIPTKQAHIRNMFLPNKVDNKTEEAVNDRGHTLESIR